MHPVPHFVSRQEQVPVQVKEHIKYEPVADLGLRKDGIIISICTGHTLIVDRQPLVAYLCIYFCGYSFRCFIMVKLLASILALAAAATAWDAPQYAGYNRVWQDNFSGASGQLPNEGNWNIQQGDLGVNNELQVYQRNPRNVQVSGGNTLQLVPWRDGSQPKGWTSGRIESKYTFTPQDGRITRLEAIIMYGNSPTGNKQGIWPAYWMLGDSIRRGTPWPACGEIDIMENVNGILTGYGTIHCDVYPGGIVIFLFSYIVG